MAILYTAIFMMMYKLKEIKLSLQLCVMNEFVCFPMKLLKKKISTLCEQHLL